MTRALRAAIVGVALFSPVALSACSAGQVTQTATQERDKVGAMAQVGDITLRQVELAYPRGGSYDAGDDAELTMAIVNTGEEADTLVSVEGEGFSSAEITGSSAEVNTAGAPAGSTPVATADEIEIAPDTTVFVGSGDLSVTLTGLDDGLTVGQHIPLVLTFENAGEVEISATVSTPSREEERGEGFDFHHSEEEGGEGSEDIARERESEVGDED
ncbi:Copper(I)-binding protein [Blastococcus aurantiacus]|uniref:Copper(I)-binding protein n=1 Tax=Blastococcus aurantiacus TaxID=1550231 RepID=A0A1G7MGD0_9ACTN|nr:copper chaperone PCu(A)C [Blastococcus aurantiacus]SDF60684.1 Copper(I)-binding protein [Blastococcus aurantiacus]